MESREAVMASCSVRLWVRSISVDVEMAVVDGVRSSSRGFLRERRVDVGSSMATEAGCAVCCGRGVSRVDS